MPYPCISQQFINYALNFSEAGFSHANLLLSKEIDFFQDLNIGIEA